MFLVRIFIKQKGNVLDPQVETLKKVLKDEGEKYILDLSRGKFFDLNIKEKSEELAIAKAEDIAKSMLSNSVTDEYTIEIL